MYILDTETCMVLVTLCMNTVNDAACGSAVWRVARAVWREPCAVWRVACGALQEGIRYRSIDHR